MNGEWTLVLAAPHALWSANDEHRAGKFDTAAMRKAWRGHTYQQVKAARLPQGLPRVRFSLTFHFTTNGRRDALNYATTAKPIIDAYGPPFTQKPTVKKPSGSSAPGWGVIDDDDPQHVEATDLAIGPLWQNVVTGPGHRLTLADITAYDRGWGGVTVTVTERPALPALAAVRRAKDPFPAELRQRLAREVFLGV